MSAREEFALPGLAREPRVHESAFVAPGVVLIGDIEIGPESSVWYGSVLRGDTDSIRVGARTNLQDGVIVHCDEGVPVRVEDEVTVGHGVILHGCTLRRRCLVGIGARVLNHADVGEESLVAAGALVPEKMKIPPRSLVVGLPARFVPLPERFLEYMERAWQHYASFAKQYKAREI